MGSEGAALDLKDVETVIHHEVREAFDALSRDLFEETLERLHQIDECHPGEVAQVPLCDLRVETGLREGILDVSQRTPDVRACPAVVKNWRASFRGHLPVVLQNVLDFPGQVDGRPRHGCSYFAFAAA